MIELNRLSRENVDFYLDTQRIAGIQDVSITYPDTNLPIKYIGMRKAEAAPRNYPVANLNVNSFLINSDQFISFTGDSGFNSYILKKDYSNPFSCQSGYLINYSNRYAVNQIPQISFSALVFGEVDNSVNETQYNSIKTSWNDYLLKQTGPGCVTIGLDGLQTGRVLSYDLNISAPRTAIYDLSSSKLPRRVFLNYPLEVSCSFQIEIENYSLAKMKDIFKDRNKTLTLTLKEFENSATINSYVFSNMYLSDENFSINIDTNATVTASYKTFLMP